MKLFKSSSEPFFRQIYRILLTRISKGEYAQGSRLPGIQTLAAEFGVSIIPVNHALDELIQNGYCVRRPKNGTFVTTAIPGTAKHHPGKTVILFSEISQSDINPVTIPYSSQLRQYLEFKLDMNILLLFGANARHQLLQLLSSDQGKEYAGVIFFAVSSFYDILEIVNSNPTIRFILLNYQFRLFEELAPHNLKGVFCDEFCGGYIAGAYLLSKGLHCTGLITYSVPDENYHLRLAGIHQAFANVQNPIPPAACLDIPPRSTASQTNHFDPADLGYESTNILLERFPRLNGIFCVNDILAAGACRYLIHKKMRDSVEVVGFDNHIEELHIANRFATVSIPSAFMTTTAAKMLLNWNDYPTKQLLLTPQLVFP